MTRDIEFERHGREEVVRIGGVVVGRLIGQQGHRRMRWRSGQLIDDDKVVTFERNFARTDQSIVAAEAELRRAGFA